MHFMLLVSGFQILFYELQGFVLGPHVGEREAQGLELWVLLFCLNQSCLHGSLLYIKVCAVYKGEGGFQLLETKRLPTILVFIFKNFLNIYEDKYCYRHQA